MSDGAAQPTVEEAGTFGGSSEGRATQRASTVEEALRLLRASHGVIEVRVSGDSMSPTLVDGDTVRVRAAAPLRFGDVAVAAARGGLLIHRVVHVGQTHVTLCGDDARRCDEPIELADVLGRVVAVDGAVHRRFDGLAAGLAGRAIAVHARARAATGNQPRRPRPARLARLYLRLADAWTPRAAIEDRLTLRLASPFRESASRADRSLAVPPGADCDWSRVAELALVGQIGPQVYAGTRGMGSDPDWWASWSADESPVGSAGLDRLRRQIYSNVARTTRVFKILDDILERLDVAGVQAMAHKGIALAATVYGDPSLRIMGDIDLSVRDEQRAAAEVAAHDIRSALARENPDRHDPGGFHVELDGTAHHDLDPALFGRGRWQTRSLDWDGIWSRARVHPVGSRQVLVPSPTDLLLTLIANSVRRGFTPVRTIVDVAHTIDRFDSELDWKGLEAELMRTGLDSRSWIALQLAVSWCGSEVPLRLLEPPPDLRTSAYERALLRWKHDSPFARLPTGVLWAGSWRGAMGAGAQLASREAAARLR